MADYCKQCSLETFDKDYKELANLTTKEDMLNGRAATVICECCGWIQVAPDGSCLGSCSMPSHGNIFENAKKWTTEGTV